LVKKYSCFTLKIVRISQESFVLYQRQWLLIVPENCLRVTLRCLASRMWPAGRTLLKPALKPNLSVKQVFLFQKKFQTLFSKAEKFKRYFIDQSVMYYNFDCVSIFACCMSSAASQTLL